MNEPVELHGIAPSGLWGHSYNPDYNLMRRNVLDVQDVPGTGWLCLTSFDTVAEAEAYRDTKIAEGKHPGAVWRIRDQFASDAFNDVIVG